MLWAINQYFLFKYSFCCPLESVAPGGRTTTPTPPTANPAAPLHQNLAFQKKKGLKLRRETLRNTAVLSFVLAVLLLLTYLLTYLLHGAKSFLRS